MIRLASRLGSVEPSATLAITALAGKMKREGKNVISLSAGEPDFPTPRNVKNEALRAIEEDFTHYTPESGIPELKEAVAKSFEKTWGIKYNSSEVIISNGAKHVIFNAIFALCDEGDEIIVITPAWVSYIEQIKLAGGKPVIVETKEENDFIPNPKDIERNITSKTKAIIINSPHNPTGTVYPRDVLIEIAKIATSRGVFVISDEIYDKLSYDEESIPLVCLLPEAKDNILIVNGASKAYAMTGWRIGWGLGPADLIKAMGIIQGHMTSNPCSISQRAALEAVKGPQETVDKMVREFRERRNLICSLLEEAPHISFRKPKGAFYLFINITEALGKKYKNEVINDDITFSRKLLEEKLVAIVPGTAFAAPGYIRISYAASRKDIEEACKRIKEFLKELI
ncbi:MAG: pyridoxal phosphate-dependent aminotransferase [Synergistetes bacterium]|nr:pyridoxal phosphate-dependent aminotransferase [Synergistota bacterium]MCX8127316.1 pyridoxal phosphate-dependent aminotransferase [Synergistota bacterium]MDW8191797.1 pyridoxal phosphate-dependent aminotransferase [Synergistota bacterium]